MAKQSRKYFVVGLFVILAFLIAAAAVVWINASKFFEQGNRYVTFFNESVQGLSKDSEVKYQGVTVGRVESIRIAPDNKTVAVTMLINLRDNLPERVVAQLSMTGITGLMFVNLVPRQPDEPNLSPKITFATEYPVIPSKPSEISQILTGVKEIVESVNKGNLEKTIKEFREAAEAARSLLERKDIKQILGKADIAVGYLRDSLKRVDVTLSKGKLDVILLDTQKAVKGAGGLVDSLGAEVKGAKIPETVKKARLTLDDARTLLDKLNRTSTTLDMLLERLYQRPSDLLFGKPPEGRFNEQPIKPKKAGR
jgi:phospholipid/cholesterol/gamma-HCH transport system substrate-binding protein